MKCPHCEDTGFIIHINIKECESKEEIANRIKNNQVSMICSHCKYIFYPGELIQNHEEPLSKRD